MQTLDLDHRFAFHPTADDTADRHAAVRAAARAFAEVVNDVCPEGRDKSLAVTKIEEAMMWANAAVARRGGDAPDAYR